MAQKRSGKRVTVTSSGLDSSDSMTSVSPTPSQGCLVKPGGSVQGWGWPRVSLVRGGLRPHLLRHGDEQDGSQGAPATWSWR